MPYRATHSRAPGSSRSVTSFLPTLTETRLAPWRPLHSSPLQAGALENHAAAVAGLVVGGLIAAPFAGHIVKRIPRRALTYAVGGLLIVLAGFQALQLAGILA